MRFSGLIPVNCAPPGSRSIGLYDSGGTRRGRIKVPDRMLAPAGAKLYSFGCVSDAHTFTSASYVDDVTANDDFQKALTFFRENADFTCVCGDLTCHGNLGEFQNYKALVDGHSGGKPVYAMAGNHEHLAEICTDDLLTTYTGHPRRYAHSHGDDVFIMCGASGFYDQFTKEDLQWLYAALEANRNKRCFLFVHPFLKGSEYCGDSVEMYPFDMLGGTYGQVFKSLLSHYLNVIYFHGHTHEMFQMQEYCQSLPDKPPSCYDNTLGCHSVHIPSLAIPIDISGGTRVVKSGESQGYLVDVYENEVLLRGRDFARDLWLPTATYKLDTTRKTIAAGTYSDPTGTV